MALGVGIDRRVLGSGGPQLRRQSTVSIQL